MRSLYLLIDTVLGLYCWVVIAAAVMSWLIAFNVVNTRNPSVWTVHDFLYRLTEPVLRPIRRRMPDFGGIDLSALLLILGLFFIRNLLAEYWPHY